VDELVEKQQRILAAASRLLKPGGRLVYATCSLLEEENEAVAAAFVAAQPEFLPLSCAKVLEAQRIALDTGEYLKLSPHRHSTDGFFAAAFERRKR
jgi:16S rRNA (cytosine967-C5)-methyltransferase